MTESDPKRSSGAFTRFAYRPQPQTGRWKCGIIPPLHEDPQPEGHMASFIGRRKLLATLGGAAAWPLAARAQQIVTPVIGFLSGFTTNPQFVTAFRQGLGEVGYVEGRNLELEYRWAEEGKYDRLSPAAADLVRARVAVIFAGPIPAALAAKAATATVPIVFAIGSDPVESGLVDSLNRPGGNLTGVGFLAVALGSKRL